MLLFLIDAQAPGITVKSRRGIDSRPIVDIEFRDVPAAPVDLICDPRHAPHLLDRAYDAGRLHLAAEMLGASQECFDRTIEYLKTRVQFGKKIGEFQALQHRAALLFGELEIARSTVLKAAATGTPEFVSMAKARVGEIAKKAATEAIQMHGGIGVTDDFDLGFYLKRIRTAAELLGDSAFHAERYARHSGPVGAFRLAAAKPAAVGRPTRHPGFAGLRLPAGGLDAVGVEVPGAEIGFRQIRHCKRLLLHA